jgi:hypothetical protein
VFISGSGELTLDHKWTRMENCVRKGESLEWSRLSFHKVKQNRYLPTIVQHFKDPAFDVGTKDCRACSAEQACGQLFSLVQVNCEAVHHIFKRISFGNSDLREVDSAFIVTLHFVHDLCQLRLQQNKLTLQNYSTGTRSDSG